MAEATRRICTIFSPAHSRTAGRSRVATIGPVITGRAVARGAAMVGHHDRQGLRDDDASKSLECVASLARHRRRL